MKKKGNVTAATPAADTSDPEYDNSPEAAQRPRTGPAILRSPLTFAGEQWERMQSSQRFHQGRFRNSVPLNEIVRRGALPLLGEYFFSRTERVPKQPLPLENPLLTWATKPTTGLRVTWLGHSTMLIELGHLRILTDPVFGLRASPLSFAGPKRFHPPPVSIAQLPKIDAVLISHDHYDHLCYSSVLALAQRDVPFITSLGVGARLTAWGIPATRISELDWWESHPLPGTEVHFTAAPAQHFSGRSFDDRNQTLWSSWVIRDDRHKVFFSGDTGLTDEFLQIGAKYGPFDLTMLEIGAWHPQWGDIHLGPENALKAHAMLGGGPLMPVHWGTFNLALHAWDEPAETLLRLAAADNTPLFMPRLGGSFEPGQARPPGPAWWRLR